VQFRSDAKVICAAAAVLSALLRLSPFEVHAYFRLEPLAKEYISNLFNHPAMYDSAAWLLAELVSHEPERYRAYAVEKIMQCYRLLRAPCAEDARADLYYILMKLISSCDQEFARSLADAALTAGFLRLPRSKQLCPARTDFETRLQARSAQLTKAADEAAEALLAEEEEAALRKTTKKAKPKKKKPSAAAASAAESADGDDAALDEAAPDTPPSLEQVAAADEDAADGSAGAEPAPDESDVTELSQSEGAVRRRRRAAQKASRRSVDSSPDAAAASAANPADTAAAVEAASLPPASAEGFTAVAPRKKRGEKSDASASAAAADAARAPPALTSSAPKPRAPPPPPPAASAVVPTPLQMPPRPKPVVPFSLFSMLPAPPLLPATSYPPLPAAAAYGSVLPPSAPPSIFDFIEPATWLRAALPSSPPPDASASGLSNAAGEYNCFLNSIVQALFRVRCFRKHLLNSRLPEQGPSPEVQRSIALVRALRDLFDALERGIALRRDADAAPSAGASHGVVAPTALRQALAALSASGGEGAMNAMADASEVLSALYEAFQSVSAANRSGLPPAETSIGRMFGLALREAAHCRAAGCGKITHSMTFRTFFHIVPRCARRVGWLVRLLRPLCAPRADARALLAARRCARLTRRRAARRAAWSGCLQSCCTATPSAATKTSAAAARPRACSTTCCRCPRCSPSRWRGTPRRRPRRWWQPP